MFVNRHATEVVFTILHIGPNAERVAAALDEVAATRPEGGMDEVWIAPTGVRLYGFIPAGLAPMHGHRVRLHLTALVEDTPFGDMARSTIDHADAIVFVAEANDDANGASWAEFQKNVNWAWRVSQGQAPPLVWRTPDMTVFPALKEALRAVFQRLASG